MLRRGHIVIHSQSQGLKFQWVSNEHELHTGTLSLLLSPICSIHATNSELLFYTRSVPGCKLKHLWRRLSNYTKCLSIHWGKTKPLFLKTLPPPGRSWSRTQDRISSTKLRQEGGMHLYGCMLLSQGLFQSCCLKMPRGPSPRRVGEGFEGEKRQWQTKKSNLFYWFGGGWKCYFPFYPVINNRKIFFSYVVFIQVVLFFV